MSHSTFVWWQAWSLGLAVGLQIGVIIAEIKYERREKAKRVNPPPAAISDCATSDVEAARNTSKLAAKKEKA